MYRVIIFALIAAVVVVAAEEERRFSNHMSFNAEELDHPYVLSYRHATFFAGMSASSPACGWLADYTNTACFYCVGAICDAIERDEEIHIHHTDDDPVCVNKLRVLTQNRDNGMCGPWIPRIAMIVPRGQ